MALLILLRRAVLFEGAFGAEEVEMRRRRTWRTKHRITARAPWLNIAIGGAGWVLRKSDSNLFQT